MKQPKKYDFHTVFACDCSWFIKIGMNRQYERQSNEIKHVVRASVNQLGESENDFLFSMHSEMVKGLR